MRLYRRYKSALRGIARQLGRRARDLKTVDFDALCVDVQAEIQKARALAELFRRSEVNYSDAVRAYARYEAFYNDAAEFGLQGDLRQPEPTFQFMYSKAAT